MPKNYNLKLVKKHHVYTIKEIAELFKVSEKTVQRWIKQGLKRIPDFYPFHIKGQVLKDYLLKKQQDRKTKLKDDELYCLKCRKGVNPINGSVVLAYSGKTVGHGIKDFLIIGICPNCFKKIYRASNDNFKNIVKANFNVREEYENGRI